MSSNQPPWGGNAPGWPPPSGAPGATPGTGPAAPSGGHPVPANPFAAPPAAPAGGHPVPASPYAAPVSPYAPPPAAAPYGGPPSPYGSPAPSTDPYAAYAQSGAMAPQPYAPPPGMDPYAAYAARPTGYAGGQVVGGWLLFLCVTLTILGPLMTLSRYAGFLSRLSELGPMFMFNVVVALALAGFSVYAGVGLWTRRANAVRMAKVYFAVRGGYAVISYALMVASVGGIAITAFAEQGIPVVLFCGGAFAYLSNSQRVKTTYGTQA